MALFAAQRASALNRAEGGQHQHVYGLCVRRVAFPAEQVAPVGRSERPRQLNLDEAEQRGGGPDRGCGADQGPLVLIAYLLGAIGTTGSGIWLMRLMSLIH